MDLNLVVLEDKKVWETLHLRACLPPSHAKLVSSFLSQRGFCLEWTSVIFDSKTMALPCYSSIDHTILLANDRHACP